MFYGIYKLWGEFPNATFEVVRQCDDLDTALKLRRELQESNRRPRTYYYLLAGSIKYQFEKLLEKYNGIGYGEPVAKTINIELEYMLQSCNIRQTVYIGITRKAFGPAFVGSTNDMDTVCGEFQIRLDEDIGSHLYHCVVTGHYYSKNNDVSTSMFEPEFLDRLWREILMENRKKNPWLWQQESIFCECGKEQEEV